MPSRYLENDDRVVRYIGWNKLRRDENDDVLGILPHAFNLRDGEEYLSVTWCEYFNGSIDQQTRCAIDATKVSMSGKKAQFAIGNVGRIRITVEGRPGAKKLRIIHEPDDGNPAHAAIRHWPQQDDDLLELLASEIWSERLDMTAANKLPVSDCSARL